MNKRVKFNNYGENQQTIGMTRGSESNVCITKDLLTIIPRKPGTPSSKSKVIFRKPQNCISIEDEAIKNSENRVQSRLKISDSEQRLGATSDRSLLTHNLNENLRLLNKSNRTERIGELHNDILTITPVLGERRVFGQQQEHQGPIKDGTSQSKLRAKCKQQHATDKKWHSDVEKHPTVKEPHPNVKKRDPADRKHYPNVTKQDETDKKRHQTDKRQHPDVRKQDPADKKQHQTDLENSPRTRDESKTYTNRDDLHYSSVSQSSQWSSETDKRRYHPGHGANDILELQNKFVRQVRTGQNGGRDVENTPKITNNNSELRLCRPLVDPHVPVRFNDECIGDDDRLAQFTKSCLPNRILSNDNELVNVHYVMNFHFDVDNVLRNRNISYDSCNPEIRSLNHMQYANSNEDTQNVCVLEQFGNKDNTSTSSKTDLRADDGCQVENCVGYVPYDWEDESCIVYPGMDEFMGVDRNRKKSFHDQLKSDCGNDASLVGNSNYDFRCRNTSNDSNICEMEDGSEVTTRIVTDVRGMLAEKHVDKFVSIEQNGRQNNRNKVDELQVSEDLLVRHVREEEVKSNCAVSRCARDDRRQATLGRGTDNELDGGWDEDVVDELDGADRGMLTNHSRFVHGRDGVIESPGSSRNSMDGGDDEQAVIYTQHRASFDNRREEDGRLKMLYNNDLFIRNESRVSDFTSDKQKTTKNYDECDGESTSNDCFVLAGVETKGTAMQESKCLDIAASQETNSGCSQSGDINDGGTTNGTYFNKQVENVTDRSSREDEYEIGSSNQGFGQSSNLVVAVNDQDDGSNSQSMNGLDAVAKDVDRMSEMRGADDDDSDVDEFDVILLSPCGAGSDDGESEDDMGIQRESLGCQWRNFSPPITTPTISSKSAHFSGARKNEASSVEGALLVVRPSHNRNGLRNDDAYKENNQQINDKFKEGRVERNDYQLHNDKVDQKLTPCLEAGDDIGDDGGRSKPKRRKDNETGSLHMTHLLYNWIVVPSHKGQTLRLDGRRRQDEEGIFWSSSRVVHRISQRQVQTTNGSTYILKGKMDLQYALSEGIDPRFSKKFQRGFPVNWRAISTSFFSQGKKRQTSSKHSAKGTGPTDGPTTKSDDGSLLPARSSLGDRDPENVGVPDSPDHDTVADGTVTNTPLSVTNQNNTALSANTVDTPASNTRNKPPGHPSVTRLDNSVQSCTPTLGNDSRFNMAAALEAIEAKRANMTKLPVSRYGRVLTPRLASWAGERVEYDQNGEPRVVGLSPHVDPVTLTTPLQIIKRRTKTGRKLSKRHSEQPRMTPRKKGLVRMPNSTSKAATGLASSLANKHREGDFKMPLARTREMTIDDVRCETDVEGFETKCVDEQRSSVNLETDEERLGVAVEEQNSDTVTVIGLDIPSGDSGVVSDSCVDADVNDGNALSDSTLRLDGNKNMSADDPLRLVENVNMMADESLRLVGNGAVSADNVMRLAGNENVSADDAIRLDGNVNILADDALRLDGNVNISADDALRLDGNVNISADDALRLDGNVNISADDALRLDDQAVSKMRVSMEANDAKSPVKGGLTYDAKGSRPREGRTKVSAAVINNYTPHNTRSRLAKYHAAVVRDCSVAIVRIDLAVLEVSLSESETGPRTRSRSRDQRVETVLQSSKRPVQKRRDRTTKTTPASNKSAGRSESDSTGAKSKRAKQTNSRKTVKKPTPKAVHESAQKSAHLAELRQQPTVKASAGSSPARLASKPGTLRRKKELRELLTEMNANYEDDIFDATPMRKKRKSCHLGDMNDDSFFGNKLPFETPTSNGTPALRVMREPVLHPKTPIMADESSFTGHNPRRIDRYLNKLKNHRRGKFPDQKDPSQRLISDGQSLSATMQSGLLEEDYKVDEGNDESIDDYWSDTIE